MDNMAIELSLSLYLETAMYSFCPNKEVHQNWLVVKLSTIKSWRSRLNIYLLLDSPYSIEQLYIICKLISLQIQQHF